MGPNVESRYFPLCTFLFIFVAAAFLSAQTNYKVITVSGGGTIYGTVKWSGPLPRLAEFPITKDPEVCDPESKKMVDLERLTARRRSQYHRLPEKHHQWKGNGPARATTAS